VIVLPLSDAHTTSGELCSKPCEEREKRRGDGGKSQKRIQYDNNSNDKDIDYKIEATAVSVRVATTQQTSSRGSVFLHSPQSLRQWSHTDKKQETPDSMRSN
jgi:hypothetical protein